MWSQLQQVRTLSLTPKSSDMIVRALDLQGLRALASITYCYCITVLLYWCYGRCGKYGK